MARSQFFKKFFDESENYIWSYCGEKLCSKYSSYFKVWWHPKKFRWSDGFTHLCEHCSDEYLFKIWWDKKRVDYKNHSHTLCMFIPEYFDIWWDSEKFNWINSDKLCIYLSKDFNKWWNNELFDWEYSLKIYVIIALLILILG